MATWIMGRSTHAHGVLVLSSLLQTAVFVLAVLQQLPKELPEGQVDTLVLCHTRELAYQICQEFLRFSKYLPEVKVKVFFGGIAIEQHRKLLATETPNVVVGTPGRILALINEKKLKLDHLKSVPTAHRRACCFISKHMRTHSFSSLLLF